MYWLHHRFISVNTKVCSITSEPTQSSNRRVWLPLKPGPRPWPRTLKKLDPEKPLPWKTWIQKNLDPGKPAPRKTCTLKHLDPGKPGPRKTWNQKNLDPKKPGPWKTWTLKNLEPKKPGSWKTWTKYRIKKYVWL